MFIALSIRRVLIGLWMALFPLLLFLWFFPVVSFSSRVAIVTVVFFIVVGSILFSWRAVALRWSLIGFYVLTTFFVLFPSHPGSGRFELRTLYSDVLASYSGCPYVWGGEGRLGMDCSGLVRRGLQDALIEYGFRTWNPYWIRKGISIWWHDTTAQGLGSGYGGRTREVMTCRTLNDVDYTSLMPGDLAVTTSGIHVMAYLGNKIWIGADPGEMRVTRFVIPEENNSYFSVPMKIMRWKILEDNG